MHTSPRPGAFVGGLSTPASEYHCTDFVWQDLREDPGAAVLLLMLDSPSAWLHVDAAEPACIEHVLCRLRAGLCAAGMQHRCECSQ